MWLSRGAIQQRSPLRSSTAHIPTGADWATSITEAIGGSRAMVLIFSGDANTSDFVRREVSLAVAGAIAVLPVRIENVVPSAAMTFFLNTAHWMDAITPPLETHLLTLAKTLRTAAATQPAAPVEIKGVGATSQAGPTGIEPAPPGRRENADPAPAAGCQSFVIVSSRLRITLAVVV